MNQSNVSKSNIDDCRVCGDESVELRNINLYTNGSEGTWMCHLCEMAVVAFVRTLQSVSARAIAATHRTMHR